MHDCWLAATAGTCVVLAWEGLSEDAHQAAHACRAEEEAQAGHLHTTCSVCVSDRSRIVRGLLQLSPSFAVSVSVCVCSYVHLELLPCPLKHNAAAIRRPGRPSAEHSTTVPPEEPAYPELHFQGWQVCLWEAGCLAGDGCPAALQQGDVDC